MAHTLEACKQIVQAAKGSDKLCQIGHQRRSNPRYWHAGKMMNTEKILGRVTHCYGQWNRARRLDFQWASGLEIPQATLEKFGYASMDEFRNWRNYRKFCGGAMTDLGSHQVDVFHWLLGSLPKAVQATGGQDYYDDGTTYDNVMALYDFQTPAGPVRGYYQVLNTTSHGGFYETFMGDQGSMVISEDERKGFVFREVQAQAKKWEDEANKIDAMGAEAIMLKVGASLKPDGTKTAEAQKMEAMVKKPVHQLHLENFFDAIRGQAELTCPPEVAYPTAVACFKANEAVASGRKIELTDKDYEV